MILGPLVIRPPGGFLRSASKIAFCAFDLSWGLSECGTHHSRNWATPGKQSCQRPAI
jgi:hypothetical protein